MKAKNGTVTVNATSVMGVEMEMEDDKVELMGMQARYVKPQGGRQGLSRGGGQDVCCMHTVLGTHTV